MNIRLKHTKEKYPKQYQQYLERTESQLEKAIKSHDKRIHQHKGFLDNPKSHAENWDKFSDIHKKNLMHHWKEDIKRHEAYRDIAKHILNEKLEVAKNVKP